MNVNLSKRKDISGCLPKKERCMAAINNIGLYNWVDIQVIAKEARLKRQEAASLLAQLKFENKVESKIIKKGHGIRSHSWRKK